MEKELKELKQEIHDLELLIEMSYEKEKILWKLHPLWRKENNESELTYPDRAEFYKWIVGKVK